MEATTLDPVLKAALAEYRSQLGKPIRDPGRVSTFFMFHSARLNEARREMEDGPRIGFSPETLGRLLALFPVWDSAKRILTFSDLAGSSRVVPVGLFTDEMVFDEASQRIYAARLSIEFGSGVEIPMRDPVSGSQMRPSGQITSLLIHRALIESWRNAEQFTIERSAACRDVT